MKCFSSKLKALILLISPLFLIGFACSKADNSPETNHSPKIDEIPALTAQYLDGEWRYQSTISNFDYNSRTFSKKNENGMEDYSILLQFEGDSAKLYGYPYLRFYNVEIEVENDLLYCDAQTHVPLKEQHKIFQFGDTLLLGFNSNSKGFTITTGKAILYPAAQPAYAVFIKTNVNKDSLHVLDSCRFNWALVYDNWHYGKDSTRIIELENGNVYQVPGFLDLSLENKSNFSHFHDILTYHWKAEAHKYKLFKKRNNALYLEYLGTLDTFNIQYFRPSTHLLLD